MHPCSHRRQHKPLPTDLRGSVLGHGEDSGQRRSPLICALWSPRKVTQDSPSGFCALTPFQMRNSLYSGSIAIATLQGQWPQAGAPRKGPFSLWRRWHSRAEPFAPLEEAGSLCPMRAVLPLLPFLPLASQACNKRARRAATMGRFLTLLDLALGPRKS